MAASSVGQNSRGELGDGVGGNQLTPVHVAGLASGVNGISAGYFHTCSVTNGGAKCWGNNQNGQLGDGTNTQRLTAADVAGLTAGVSNIDAGQYNSCAVVNGGVKCWGNNFGQTAVDVADLTTGVSAVAIGEYHYCALKTDGTVKCWGAGLLGDGNMASTWTDIPVDVIGLEDRPRRLQREAGIPARSWRVAG